MIKAHELHQDTTLARQGAGEGFREEVASDQVLTNRDAKRGLGAAFQGKEVACPGLASKNTPDHGHAVGDYGVLCVQDTAHH